MSKVLTHEPEKIGATVLDRIGDRWVRTETGWRYGACTPRSWAYLAYDYGPLRADDEDAPADPGRDFEIRVAALTAATRTFEPAVDDPARTIECARQFEAYLRGPA